MPPISLKGRVLRLLSGREYSRAELERKLKDHAETPGALAQALDDLQAKDFINEARVVESVVHRRAPKLGTQRIRQELQAKGLEPEVIAKAVAQLRTTEVDRAREVWRKKFGIIPVDAVARLKQMRFLAGRGFAGDVVGRVVPRVGAARSFSAGADAPD